ncbi:hypothetical protein AAC03nite_14070 [Alicyclobacillus acidoterrestris]|uniref:MFS transporter n=1 Tax=Alicyclobacillus suci TaxID=2816080 RepID=UPI0011973611|nr:MFS transporter [Alicyclobacillus suci]GEO25622.1 hypothetical protein AAC03nite_14070 [Alicyclobacillus acidoterrestris]
MEPTVAASEEYRRAVEHTGLLAPIRSSRNFAALWLGQTLSQFGDAVLWVTLPLAVFHTANANATLQLGIIMGLFMLPQVVLLLFTGWLADRVSRIRTMMTTDVIRCLLVSTLAVLYMSGLLDMRVLAIFVLAYGVMEAVTFFFLSFVDTTPMLMVLMAIANAGSMLFGVVWEGSMQELVHPEAYGRAASLDYFGSWVLLPVGNVLTGWLAAQVGGIHAVWAESAFMLLIVVITMSVPAVRKFD